MHADFAIHYSLIWGGGSLGYLQAQVKRSHSSLYNIHVFGYALRVFTNARIDLFF